MKFFFVFAFSAVPLLVSATPITSDPVYDNATESLGAVACSDGPNGMLTKGYNVFGDLKTFPYIGGSSAVAAWNSPNCGTCWNVTYGNKTVTVTVIDHADDGYNLSQEAMNNLTDGHAVDWGVVDGSGVQVPNSLCGLA